MDDKRRFIPEKRPLEADRRAWRSTHLESECRHYEPAGSADGDGGEVEGGDTAFCEGCEWDWVVIDLGVSHCG